MPFMLADDILALLKKKSMTAEELAKKLKQRESVVLAVLIKELSPELVEMKSGVWKRKAPMADGQEQTPPEEPPVTPDMITGGSDPWDS